MIFCSALLRITSRNIFKVENFHLIQIYRLMKVIGTHPPKNMSYRTKQNQI